MQDLLTKSKGVRGITRIMVMLLTLKTKLSPSLKITLMLLHSKIAA